jgi:poly-beta-1,6-N-acetyl-D-glucosamine synthase
MSAAPTTYAVVTPAWNEAAHLTMLASSLVAQTFPPDAWVIVDHGSTDATAEVAARLESRYEWIHVLKTPRGEEPGRGRPIVRAFTAALPVVPGCADIIVKLDADVTFGSQYFARLLEEFRADPSLGIASGTCYEWDKGEWRPRYGTRSIVWGANRAYRRECLGDILPLEERQGWDEIDALKARLRGWSTRTVPDLAFRHHRRIGERDGRRRRWMDQGATAHYMGYRPSYLLARALFRGAREPDALAMLWGYARTAVRGSPRLPDTTVREYLRDQQRLRTLRLRAREARGRVS